uniref:Uncharacterized protein n=1 Tax=Cacopsylla melanoneura TaxID=428564 RepID=A0A8D8TW98_9HEMI
MVPLSCRMIFLNMVLILLPTNIKCESRTAKWIKTFQEMFPQIDIKSEKVFHFVEDEENLRQVMKANTLECYAKKHRLKRSVYSLMAVPMDLMYSTPISTTYCNEYDPDRYGYIDPAFYNNLNMTSSELMLSKEGWDYSPYVPPGETTTEFVFPSWNYDGKCPEAFFKEWTAHEQDMEQSTFDQPDQVNGYTDAEHMKINSFDDVYNTFWDTILNLPHACDNYTSYWACLQGKPVVNPMMIDPTDDPVD